MFCFKCNSFLCVCKKEDNSFTLFTPQKPKCLWCGGTGWEKVISKGDVCDPHSYDGPCRACGWKRY